MYCRFCGCEFEEGARFCSKCGKAKAVDDQQEQENVVHVPLDLEKGDPVTDGVLPEEVDTSLVAGLEEAFVGKNYPYFTRKWDQLEKKKNKMNWNWAAFFFGPFYFGYRKMYMPVIFLCAAYLVIDLILYLVNYQFPEQDYYFTSIDRALAMPIAMCFGLVANASYMKHTNKYIEKSALLPLNVEQKKLWLKKKGGRSWVGVLIAAGIFALYGIITMFFFPTNIDMISTVKDGSFYAYPTETIGDQFDGFFDEPHWEYIKSDGAYDMVRFTGVAVREGTPVNLTIDFILDDEAFGIHSAKIGTEELNSYDTDRLLEMIFTKEEIDPTL